MESKKNLVFLGMMCSGKTSIGSIISKKLKLKFIDIDQEIEKELGMKISKIFELCGFDIKNFPLSDYRDKSFYFMITDSLDRFGTKLEKRFTKKEIEQMLLKAGFMDIKFSENTPYWVALAWKRKV